jgi:hypothetical protein
MSAFAPLTLARHQIDERIGVAGVAGTALILVAVAGLSARSRRCRRASAGGQDFMATPRRQ